MANIQEILASCNALLTPEKYRDYAPNGLQVQGRRDVKVIVTGVSASLELIQAAHEHGADAIFVHHGWFWKREDPRITGVRYGRIAALLESGMHLAAFHLPLDDNDLLGNNALLGKALGLTEDGRFGEDNLGRIGLTETPMSVNDMAEKLSGVLSREPLTVGPKDVQIRRVAWCTGAAQDMLEEAYEAGADCFISGEISERTTLIARELGIPYFACGHHATERFGIRALGDWIASKYNVQNVFIDIDNPA